MLKINSVIIGKPRKSNIKYWIYGVFVELDLFYLISYCSI